MTLANRKQLLEILMMSASGVIFAAPASNSEWLGPGVSKETYPATQLPKVAAPAALNSFARGTTIPLLCSRRRHSSTATILRRHFMSIATSPTLDARVINFIGRTGKILIDGKWSDAASGKTFDTYKPATGEVLARVAEGGR